MGNRPGDRRRRHEARSRGNGRISRAESGLVAAAGDSIPRSGSERVSGGSLVFVGRCGPPPGLLVDRGRACLQLLALFPACRARDPAPLRRRRPGPPAGRVPAGPVAEQDVEPLALPVEGGGDRGRPLLWLLDRRPEGGRAGRLACVRPGEGPARPLREGHLFPPLVRPRGRQATGPECRQGAAGGAPPRRAGVRLGRRPPPAPRVGRGDLRDARPRLHEQPDERRPGEEAGDVCRRGREDPLPEGAGGHGGRAAPRAGARPAGGELLGVHDAQLLRAPSPLRRGAGRRPRRVPGDGQGPARGGHRGHPRRGLQPHGRVGRDGADLQLQGDRQRRVLPDVRRPPLALSRLLRHREYPRLLQRPRPHHDPRQPALLGDRDARGRLPVRPGLRAHPGHRGRDRWGPTSRC